jgi:hypothetical protein
MTFLQTGLRVSETCALTVDDIDLVIRTLAVRIDKAMSARTIELEKKGTQALKSWLLVLPATSSSRLFLNRDEPLGSAKYKNYSPSTASWRESPNALATFAASYFRLVQSRIRSKSVSAPTMAGTQLSRHHADLCAPGPQERQQSDRDNKPMTNSPDIDWIVTPERRSNCNSVILPGNLTANCS